jgi:hypothetical protein
MLYSKNGSIPYPYKDETDGWIEVEDPPTASEGQEVVWWYPPGWVVRPVKPEGSYAWSQSAQEWVQFVEPVISAPQSLNTVDISGLTSTDIQTLTTAQIPELTTSQLQTLSTTQVSAIGGV